MATTGIVEFRWHGRAVGENACLLLAKAGLQGTVQGFPVQAPERMVPLLPPTIDQ